MARRVVLGLTGELGRRARFWRVQAGWVPGGSSRDSLVADSISSRQRTASFGKRGCRRMRTGLRFLPVASQLLPGPDCHASGLQ